MPDNAFDLSRTFIHLGLGAGAVAIPDFSWSADFLKQYIRTFVGDRDEGRLVGIVPVDANWKQWECHTGGDEIVVQLSGRSIVMQELADGCRELPMAPGEALINPRGVWHTVDVDEPGQTLFIAAGRLTRYRPRR